MSKISEPIRQRVQNIIAEQNAIIMERPQVIRGIWIGRIAQEHVIMFGPGGTGKSFLARDVARRIEGAVRFETALDEQSVPDQVFGPPDIKGMVEEGKTRRVLTGMLPEATDAFIDEVMNANATVKHSLQPIMNERLFHNNGLPMDVPLRQLIAGTNHNNADTDPVLAPFFDRFHIRYTVGYLQRRESRFDMVTNAIARMALVGRGTATTTSTQAATVTLEELDTAHAEALSLDIEDVTMALIDEIWEELRAKGLIISDRRYVEGYAAVLANAWLNGHETVVSTDLDILADMWWSIQDQAADARNIILSASNPGEKAALDLLDQLDKLKQEIKAANDSGIDDSKLKKLGVEKLRNTERLIAEATENLEKARAAGTSTARLEEVLARGKEFKDTIARDLFKLNPDDLAGK